MKRRVEITTPLGEALKFHRLVGREALSQAYVFDVDLIGSSNALDPMRESERVTENWSSVLEAKARQAETRSTPAMGSAPESEAA